MMMMIIIFMTRMMHWHPSPGGQPATGTVGEVLMPIQSGSWKLVLSTLPGAYVDLMAFERDLIANSS